MLSSDRPAILACQAPSLFPCCACAYSLVPFLLLSTACVLCAPRLATLLVRGFRSNSLWVRWCVDSTALWCRSAPGAVGVFGWCVYIGRRCYSWYGQPPPLCCWHSPHLLLAMRHPVHVIRRPCVLCLQRSDGWPRLGSYVLDWLSKILFCFQSWPTGCV
jgi:hypothetical protein